MFYPSLRWQAGEFHFGSACLSIYLKLSNSNCIFHTIAENENMIQSTQSLYEEILNAPGGDDKTICSWIYKETELNFRLFFGNC